MADELTGKQRRYLRSLAHAQPIATQVGREGLSAALIAAVAKVFEKRELVRIRVGRNGPEDRAAAAAEIAAKTGSAVVQLLGHTILLYRRHPETPEIRLPSAKE